MQNLILENPERGDLIVGGGGLRKLRYALPGRGKSGGMRTIYYWRRDAHQVLMLVAYPKSEKDDLSDVELAILCKFIEEI
ncbi:MAG: type II toxin-antitoxin system RelE/ParE family toxin [Thiomonas sp.]